MHIVYGDCDDGDNGNDVKSINEQSLQGPFLCKMCVSVVAVVRIVDTEVDDNAADDVEYDNDDNTNDDVEDQPDTSHHVTRRGQGVLKPGRHLRYLQEM